MKKKINGADKRREVAAARARVLRVARRRGYITHKQARAVGRWRGAWYHLRLMVKARQLKHAGPNRWEPR
jgi:hypothetical protein